MLLLIGAIFFIFGAIVASFTALLTDRLSTGQDFITGRSRCDLCGAVLSPFALIPIVSYTLSGGKTFCCRSRLSARYPITEAFLGAVFVEVYLTIGFTLALPVFLFTLSALLALVLYDLKHQILPTSILGTFVVASAIAGLLLSSSYTGFLYALATALLIGMMLALIHFLSKGRAMGLADAPLAFGLALLVGPIALSGLIYSFWIGAVVGIVLLLRRPPGSRMGVEVPFAPFLAAGFLLAYFTQWNLLVLTGLLH
jgi:leader peptidase (prepilin peptidase) / N-methyltransferase